MGVRSSCDASAVNCDSRFTAASRRSSMLFQVSESRASSSPAAGTSKRCDRFSMPMDCAARVIASTGWSARRLIQYPPSEPISSTNGVAHSSTSRKRRSVSSVPSSGAATRIR